MDEPYFESHASLILSRWPKVWQCLQNQNVESVSYELVEGKQSTICLDGVQISSRHNRTAEAELQALCSKSSPIFYLYGTGLGDLPRALLARNSLKRLEVKIMNASLFVLVLHLVSQIDWLSDPRVNLSFAAGDHEVQIPFFALPPELHLADDASSRIRDRLLTEVVTPFANLRFKPDTPILVNNIEANKPLLVKDRDVGELFLKHSGSDAWVVGAGPTLQSNLIKMNRYLDEVKVRPIVICADTAAKTLLAHNIKPDYVVILDYRNTAEHLPIASSKELALVYFPVLPHSTLTAWEGVRYVAYSSSAVYDSLHRDFPRSKLFTSGSVIHPAIDLAVQIGCSNVTLFGTDFAFPGNKTHTGWENGELRTFVEHADRWVHNGWGKRITSTHNFISYLGDVERYIEHNKKVVFLNTSKEGALITGCSYHNYFVT